MKALEIHEEQLPSTVAAVGVRLARRRILIVNADLDEGGRLEVARRSTEAFGHGEKTCVFIRKSAEVPGQHVSTVRVDPATAALHVVTEVR